MVLVEKMKKKTSRGRQKIEINKIDKAITIDRSPSRNVEPGSSSKPVNYQFYAAQRLRLSSSPKPKNSPTYLTGSTPLAAVENFLPVHELNQCYAEVLKQLEEEKGGAIIEKSKKVGEGGFWWDEPIDNMGLEELEQYMQAMEELRKKVAMRHDELMMMGMGTSSSSLPNHVGLGDDFIVQ